jgi:hypothetical protein
MIDTILSALGPQIAILATFVAVILAVYAIYLLTMYRADQLRKRLSNIQQFDVPSSGKSSGQEEGFQVHWLKPVGEIIAPSDEWRRSEIKKWEPN